MRRNLRAIYLGEYAAELVATLLHEHDPHERVFDRLEFTLGELASPRLEQAFVAFELDLLRDAGFLPELSRCVNCRVDPTAMPRAFFSAAAAGVVCRNCEASFPSRIEIDPRLLRILQTILALPVENGSARRLPMLTRHQTDPLNGLLAEHVRYASGKQLRLERYVRGSR